MKVAIVGYGKMGKEIEKILIKRGHTVVSKLQTKPTVEHLKDVDVAVEFSNPEAAFENIKFLLENKIPTISGTTGWTDRLDKIIQINEANDAVFLYASNFSLGV